MLHTHSLKLEQIHRWTQQHQHHAGSGRQGEHGGAFLPTLTGIPSPSQPDTPAPPRTATDQRTKPYRANLHSPPCSLMQPQVSETPPTRPSSVRPEGSSMTVTTLGCCVSGLPAQLLLVLVSVPFSFDTSAFDFLLPVKGYS